MKKLKDLAKLRPHSAAAPAFVAYNSRSLSQGDELVRRNALVLFVQTIGPVNIKVHGAESTQAKVQSGIVTGVETGLAEHGLGLYFPTVVSHHAGSNRAAV
jgi:hypothetical protein